MVNQADRSIDAFDTVTSDPSLRASEAKNEPLPAYSEQKPQKPISKPASRIVITESIVEENGSKASTPKATQPLGWPDPRYDLTKPFRFLDLSGEIRTQILGYLLVESPNIQPYYNNGTVELPEQIEPFEENNTALLLSGNKQFYEDSSAVLYGRNTFLFHDPKVGLWWLKRIGSNVKRLRRIQFWLSEGEANPIDIVYTLKEKQWSMLFHWLQNRHELQKISISFLPWNEADDEHKYINEDIVAAREDSIQCLFEYRGLKHANVEAGAYVGQKLADMLERSMLLPKGEKCEEFEKFNNTRMGERGRRQYWKMEKKKYDMGGSVVSKR